MFELKDGENKFFSSVDLKRKKSEGTFFPLIWKNLFIFSAFFLLVQTLRIKIKTKIHLK